MAASANDVFQYVGEPGTATTLSSPGYTIGNASINVASTTNWPTTTGVVFAIDTAEVVNGAETRVDGSYCVFAGTVNSGTSINNLTLLAGTPQNYSAGALTRVYVASSSQWAERLINGLLNEHSQLDGSHTDITADSIEVEDLTITGDLTIEGAANSEGWSPLSGTISTATGYNKGNKEFELDTSVDLSTAVSPGMRFKIARGTTPPTQCTDLESSSSQYATLATGSVSGVTFTDDFTCEAWVKLESYTSGSSIISRYDGSTGWRFYIVSDGTVAIAARQSASATDQARTAQSIPLGRWVHIAATMDISGTTGQVYIDGIAVPMQTYTNGSSTSITQAGPLQIGAENSTVFFDGKIADVRVWSAVRTATEIRDNMNQQLVGNESNLVGYWKLNGDFNDSTANANNLTGQNSAVATNVDNPMNATEYGIITKVTSNKLTVFTGTDYNIPNMTLSTPFYSTQATPFGFPSSKSKWLIEFHSYDNASTFSSGAWTNSGSIYLTIPIGAWNIQARVFGDCTRNAATAIALAGALSESSSTVSTGYAHSQDIMTTGGASGTQRLAFCMKPKTYKVFTAQTVVYHVIYATISAGALSSGASTSVANGHTLIAECAYI